MKKNILKKTLIALFIAILFLPSITLAVDPLEKLTNIGAERGPYGINPDEYQAGTALSSYIGKIIRITLSLLGIFFIILMLYAGYNWMTASGDEQKLTKAKSTIRMAIIGLLIIISAYAIYSFIWYNLFERINE